MVKCLTIVDDASAEAVAIVPARALGGLPVTRVLDSLAYERGLHRSLLTDKRTRVLRTRHAAAGA